MARKIIDLPLHQDSASLLLPFVVGLMLYVIMLVSTVALGLSFYIQTMTQTHLTHVTLELPTSMAQHHPNVEKQILDRLKRFPQIVSVHPVSEQHIHNTLLPWLEAQKEGHQGQSLLSTLSFPILIDITFQKEAPPGKNTDFLHVLQQTFPEASFVVHEALAEHLSQGLKTVAWFAWGSAGIFLSVALLAVASTVQTGVAIHRPIVEILHLMGASEKYISRQFQRQTLKTTLKSFLCAGFLLVLTFIFIQIFLEGAPISFSPTQEFYERMGLLFIFVPLISVGLILLITHLTVMISLRRMPF